MCSNALVYISAHNTASGGCKTTQDWRGEFATLKSWSTGGKGNFDTVKIFSTSGCDALSNAVPAAMETGIKLWVGMFLDCCKAMIVTDGSDSL